MNKRGFIFLQESDNFNTQTDPQIEESSNVLGSQFFLDFLGCGVFSLFVKSSTFLCAVFVC